MVDNGEHKADHGKVKEEAPVGVVGVERELVVAGHDGGSQEIGEDGASENDQDVLGDEAPGRVARPEEGRLKLRG